MYFTVNQGRGFHMEVAAPCSKPHEGFKPPRMSYDYMDGRVVNDWRVSIRSKSVLVPHRLIPPD
jgi:hypothetical protein